MQFQVKVGRCPIFERIILANRIKISVFIYHSIENNERSSKMSSELKLVQNISSYAVVNYGHLWPRLNLSYRILSNSSHDADAIVRVLNPIRIATIHYGITAYFLDQFQFWWHFWTPLVISNRMVYKHTDLDAICQNYSFKN